MKIVATDIPNLTQPDAAAGLRPPVPEDGPSFGDILKNSLQHANRMQMETDQAVNQVITGEETNIHQVMIAMEKASLSLELMTQVRNKVLAAYDEIKRMQV